MPLLMESKLSSSKTMHGFSPIIRCKECAWIPKCENCDVSLTYHKHQNALVCHYCGYTIQLPNFCPVCRQPSIEIVGYGTERIEDDIESIFKDSKIARMDLDTTRSKTSYETIIDSFSNRKTQILVGTQMVTKGLDFDGVSIVGILNADNMINFPDFRAHEKSLQYDGAGFWTCGKKAQAGNCLHTDLRTRASGYQIRYQTRLSRILCSRTGRKKSISIPTVYPYYRHLPKAP